MQLQHQVHRSNADTKPPVDQLQDCIQSNDCGRFASPGQHRPCSRLLHLQFHSSMVRTSSLSSARSQGYTQGTVRWQFFPACLCRFCTCDLALLRRKGSRIDCPPKGHSQDYTPCTDRLLSTPAACGKSYRQDLDQCYSGIVRKQSPGSEHVPNCTLHIGLQQCAHFAVCTSCRPTQLQCCM